MPGCLGKEAFADNSRTWSSQILLIYWSTAVLPSSIRVLSNLLLLSPLCCCFPPWHQRRRKTIISSFCTDSLNGDDDEEEKEEETTGRRNMVIKGVNDTQRGATIFHHSSFYSLPLSKAKIAKSVGNAGSMRVFLPFWSNFCCFWTMM